MRADTRKEDYITIEQIKRLYSQSPLGFIATIVNAALITFILWDDINRLYIAGWVVALIAVISVRFFHRNEFLKSDLTTTRDAIRWRRRFLWSLFITGAIWGSTAIFLHLSRESIMYQVIIAFVLGGMVAGSVGVYSAYFPAILTFAVPGPTMPIFSAAA